MLRALILLLAAATTGGQLDGQLGGQKDADLGSVLYPGEYCEGGSFRAECRPDEVVVMVTAKYGRMRIGKCIGISLGNIGCQLDVLPQFDQWCSGRRSCEVRVSQVYDHIPDPQRPCSKEVRSYLEASFTCVQVSASTTQQCVSRAHAPLAAPPAGGPPAYLASLVTEETGCGSLHAPWLLRAAGGGEQRLRLTLWDFNTAGGEEEEAGEVAEQGQPRVCTVYAVIKEPSAAVSRRETVCGGRGGRRRVVYTSVTSQVEVRVMASTRRAQTDGYFLLQYEALGCAAYTPPAGGWARRAGDRVTVTCNHTAASWTLTCVDGRWTGEDDNCTVGAAVAGSSLLPGEAGLLGLVTGAQWAAVVIIAAIAVTLGLIIFLVGLVYLRS